LTIHADRGSSKASKPVALADLGLLKSHSRPRVSINCYSESPFTTLKYRPTSPAASPPSKTPGRSAPNSFHAHNSHHRPVGLGGRYPAVVHTGQAETVCAQRALVL